MRSTFVIRAEAREIKMLGAIMVRLTVKVIGLIALSVWQIARHGARRCWTVIQDGSRCGRGWR